MSDKYFGYNSEEYKKFRQYAWRYLILFSVMYCFFYCIRLNLANAGAVMMSELPCTKADIGIMTGILFWTYGLGQLINGRLGEIFGPEKFIFLAVLLSVSVNVLIGFQHSLVVITLLWGLNGYFQSMVWTPGFALMTRWWPGKLRGFAVGVIGGFSGAGQFLAALSVTLSFLIFPDLGWKAAFFFPPLLPFIALIFYKVFSKADPREIGLKEYAEDDPLLVQKELEMMSILEQRGKLYPYIYLFKNRKFLICLVIQFFTGLATYGLLTWIPLYFIEKFHINVTSGLLQSLAVPLGMAIGTFVVPWLTDRYCPTNRLPAVIQSAVLGAAAIFVFLYLNPHSTLQSLGIECLLVTAGFCVFAIHGIAFAFSSDIGGRVFSGTSSGVLDFASYMGAAVQSFFYGYLLDLGGWNIVFYSISGCCLIIAGLGFLAKRKAE